MPRRESDLSNCFIYCLESNDGCYKYIGSTNDIHRRLIHHKYRCTHANGSNYNLKIYQTIRDNGGFDNFTCRTLEERSFVSLRDKLKRETYWIKQINPNMNIVRGYN